MDCARRRKREAARKVTPREKARDKREKKKGQRREGRWHSFGARRGGIHRSRKKHFSARYDIFIPRYGLLDSPS